MKIPPYFSRPLFAAAVLAAGPALAADGNVDVNAELATLKKQFAEQQALIEQQQKQLNQLQKPSADQKLDAQRAKEIRELVDDVLRDAEQRNSLNAGGPIAGFDRGFFIATPDGNNTLRFNATAQVRYVATHRNDNFSQGVRTVVPGGVPPAPVVRTTTTTNDDFESGFQLRRLQLNFQGNVISPEWIYRFRLSADAEGGTFRPDYAYIGYVIDGNSDIIVGQFKAPFLREELVGSARQLAVERSFTADYFTADYVQGVQYNWWQDRLQLTGALHDGSYSWRTDFDADRTNLAAAARAEYILVGDVSLIRDKNRRQISDFTSWVGELPAVVLGAAVDYEWGESSGTVTQTSPATATIAGPSPNIFKYTADISIEGGGWNAFVAFIGQAIDDNEQSAIVSGVDVLQNASQYGLVAQAGAFVIPDKLEPFVRFEWINFDNYYYRNDGGTIQTWVTGAATPPFIPADELRIVTTGANYYFAKHNAKLTADVQYILDAVPVANRGQGILASPDGDQIVGRVQLTLNF